MSTDPVPVSLAGITRAEFVAEVAQLVMAAQVSQAAPLLLGSDSRAEVLKRAARLSVQAADPLWVALADLPPCGHDVLRVQVAVRSMAQMIGWFGDLAHRGPEDRDAVTRQSVLAAVCAAEAVVKALDEQYP